MFKKLLLLTLCISSFKYVFPQIEYCTTPDNKDGSCIELQKCSPLMNLIQTKPISSDTRTFLQRSHCGFAGKQPKVCCANTPTVETKSNVYNYHLLPNTSVCGLSDAPNRIYGGIATELDEFPWMALVQYTKSNNAKAFYCGGVLISSKYVMTAAHCTSAGNLPKSISLTGVRLGEYNTATDIDCTKDGCAPSPLDVPVQSVIVHELYNPLKASQDNDIALLRLEYDVPFSEFVKPICLPISKQLRQKNFLNANVTAAGWGRTENGSDSEVKLKVRFNVVSNEQCGKVYRATSIFLTPNHFCAGGIQNKDTCRGDSGGPLMIVEQTENNDYQWYTIGIVSFGPSPCGLQGWPGVYTKIANYVEWIAQNIAP